MNIFTKQKTPKNTTRIFSNRVNLKLSHFYTFNWLTPFPSIVDYAKKTTKIISLVRLNFLFGWIFHVNFFLLSKWFFDFSWNALWKRLSSTFVLFLCVLLLCSLWDYEIFMIFIVKFNEHAIYISFNRNSWLPSHAICISCVNISPLLFILLCFL